MYSVQCTLYTVHCTLYTQPSSLDYAQHVLFAFSPARVKVESPHLLLPPDVGDMGRNITEKFYAGDTFYVLRVTCYVLRVTCYVLRVTC